VKKGTHNETWIQGGQRYWDAILNFINEVFASEVGGSFRSFEDVPQDRPSSKGVTIGVGSDVSTQASSIPIMPSNLIGMAIEATSLVHSSQKTSVSDASGNKKKL
jgi:hypothetical protein